MANNGSNDAFRDARHAEDNISEFKGEQEDARKADDGNEAHSVTGSPRDLISRVLDFLSNASNETLGACLVALGAATWVVLGRVGLVLMGIIGGIVLHATWETSTQGSADAEAHNKESRKRREKGLEIVARVLDWRDRLKDGITLKRAEEVSDKGSDFIGFQPETGVAMLGLTDAIIRDYVKWWYSPVLPLESSFPFACRQTLTGFFLSVSSHLSRKRPADTFLDFLTNSSSIVIVFLSELSAALKVDKASGDVSNAVQAFLEANPTTSLCNVLDVEQQNRKLRAIAEDILHSFVEPKAYACEPVRAFLREILAGVVLQMTITSCSRPESINEWIIYSLEEGSTEILDAIDAGVGGATANGNVKGKVKGGTEASYETDHERSSLAITDSQITTEHKRTVSRAEEAMEEAMQEAKRLSELIAREESKKSQSQTELSSPENSSTTQMTPTSSRDDLPAISDGASPAVISPAASRDDLSIALEDNAELTDADKAALDAHETKIQEASPSFTTFDQIISSQKPTALQASHPLASKALPLTLFNASVSIFDDSKPGEKGTIRSKPTLEYLLQIEPASSQHPGWMMARKYSDFETLHEVLRRISVISGVAAFTEKHPTLPVWKSKTKAVLRSDLERYLRDACSFQRLAESEGMKRFLEKDQQQGGQSPQGQKGTFAFPAPAAFETMSKGMPDGVASGPKASATGGKTLLGGVTGILGGIGSVGQKKQHSSSSTNPSATSAISPPAKWQVDSNSSPRPSFAAVCDSNESQTSRQSMSVLGENDKPPLPRRQSHIQGEKQAQNGAKTSEIMTDSVSASHASMEDISTSSLAQEEEQELHLPPPPSEIADDYNVAQAIKMSLPNADRDIPNSTTSAAPNTQSSPLITSISSLPSTDSNPSPPQKPTQRSTPTPLTSQETSVAVELFFATINELYTLSSAWTLRLTLLNAAKSFLLRPGNPNLEAIRALLQSTIIDANTSDTGIATHLQKIRENALPTEEELKAWPPPPSDEVKERMRIKARKLLVEKGMPQALTSVMGAAASGEALGRVFDCLQIPEVARGLVFALVLQGVKAVTQ